MLSIGRTRVTGRGLLTGQVHHRAENYPSDHRGRFLDRSFHLAEHSRAGVVNHHRGYGQYQLSGFVSGQDRDLVGQRVQFFVLGADGLDTGPPFSPAGPGTLRDLEGPARPVRPRSARIALIRVISLTFAVNTSERSTC